MTRTRRIEEIMEAMKSFGKDKYEKSELLDEMFKLQQDIVRLTFNGDDSSTSDLRIWDVERHLEQRNRDCGNVADEELRKFKEGSKALCNLIKAEISGNRGEAKAFRFLQNIRTRNIILRNVELSDGNRRAELDAIVITPAAVTIIEVKNTGKNIFIDENGDYFRTGEFLRLDCNIADKMAVKEDLLRNALADTALRNVPIRSILTFTNNRIEIHNKYSGIRTCFASQLSYVVNSMQSSHSLSEEEMEHIEEMIRNAECKEAYPFGFDVAQFKKDFATLLTILEEASMKPEEKEETVEIVVEKKVSVRGLLKKLLTSSVFDRTGSAAATAALTIISAVVVNAIRK